MKLSKGMTVFVHQDKGPCIEGAIVKITKKGKMEVLTKYAKLTDIKEKHLCDGKCKK